MRIEVEKCLFVGASTCRSEFFEKAQELGVIHFVEDPAGSKMGGSQEVLDAVACIKILMTLPPLEQIKEKLDKAVGAKICSEVLQTHKELIELQAKAKELKVVLEETRPLGAFSLKELHTLEKDHQLKFRFFTCPKSSSYRLHLPKELVLVGENQEVDYFLAIQREPVEYPKLVEVLVKEPLEEVERRAEETAYRIKELGDQLEEFARYKDFIHDYLLSLLNLEHLHFAQSSVAPAINGSLFVVYGWVPVSKKQAVFQMSSNLGVFVQQVAKESNDAVPTYLENEGFHRIGEDLVHIYDTPSLTDKDPSFWVLIFFGLFFGIIVGDAGYGLIYLAIAVYLWFRYPKTVGMKRRVLKLFTFLSAACVLWGVLAGSYFSIKLSIDNPLRDFSLIQWMAEKKAAFHIAYQDETYQEILKTYPSEKGVTDPHHFIAVPKGEAPNIGYPVLDQFADSIMMELALFIGVVHMGLSMLRNVRRQWSSLGWFIFVAGAYLYIPEYLHRVSLIHFIFGVDPIKGAAVGKQLMQIGGGLAIGAALIQHRFMGILEVANVIQLLTDVLSYLRLYALALAGAVMGATINEMTAGIPLVFGIIILFAAHAVNMGLGIMGGVIHGLRLNFLEWYHYSFEGGGKRFKPLKILTKDD